MLEIENRRIGRGESSFVIAEVGVNHNGDPALAKAMIDAIAESGADCVKFQTFNAEEFVNSPDEVYEYVSQGTTVRESMLAMFQRLELKYDEFADLFSHARAMGLIPLSTPTDRAAVDLLDDLGVGAFKVGSDDLVYTPFLKYVAQKGKPIIISTGMAWASDIERAVRTIEEAGNNQIIILHCVSQYPTPDEDVNLRKIGALQERFPNYLIGFSDHSFGTVAAQGAIALGACVIEKHFTLDRNLPGPDHRFSADPQELTSLVRDIRRLERNLGSRRLEPTKTEEEMALLCHRSIVTIADLPAGTILEESHLGFKRPGNGMMPYAIEEIIGRRLTSNISAGVQLSREVLE